VDLDLERRVQAFLRQAIQANLVASAHDLSDGGLAVALAEACIASGLGAQMSLPSTAERWDRLLFGEGGARVLVSVPPERQEAWQALLAQGVSGEAPPPAMALGWVGSSAELVVRQGETVLVHLPVAQMHQAYEQAIPRRMRGASLPPDR
jgi:phosphoribosylformylglycinamidine synthase